jgi:CBS domain-containing protein
MQQGKLMSGQSGIDACVIGKLCQRNVISIGPNDDITVAAQRMREAHVGCLIVSEPIADSDEKKVIGMLTDRDIVVSVVARDVAPRSLKVSDVMSRAPLMIAEDASIDAALSFMRDAGVRRVAVTGSHGQLVGVLSLDDVLERMAEQLTKITTSMQVGQRTERLVRR